ncbi:MAG TPA: M23 family metallopeptidase [Thermoanaerobaculia bacterium]|nr:M23 family metallopeptidase [Thermoanaerobaculia bacterium]
MLRHERRQRASGCFTRSLLLLAVAALALAALSAFWVGGAPKVELEPKLPGIGRNTPIDVVLDDAGRATRLRVELVQQGKALPVAERTFAPRPQWKLFGGGEPQTVTVGVGRDTVKGLRSGPATVRATVERAGSWARTPAPVVAEVELPVRLAPPALGVLSLHHFAAQGGSECVVYQVGPTAVRDGVRSGAWWFPGHPLPGAGKGARFALFGIPYDLDDPSKIRLTAFDDVGNEAAVGFVDQFKRRPPGTDTIEVDDRFMNKVVPEILGNSPELDDRGGLLENYLAINRELRKKNNERLKQLARRSARRFLWDQAFLPMANTAITAAFADRRTYLYNGREIDQQYHLGFDMASVERDAVPASNRGVVLLAGYFGIFGNAVVLDHGYGLQSLYGHFSTIEVAEGQRVERGQTLGRSGQTGLAGGDHLHFTMLLGGLPVHPVEWWDPHWIQDRVARKLGRALPFKP